MAGYTKKQRDEGTHEANIRWMKTDRKFGGGLPELSWKIIRDIQKGEEILVDYSF